MIYIEELTSQLLKLNKKNKIKINVHFVVSEPLTSFCVEVNKKLDESSIGFINMGYDTIILPHISICMGYIENYDTLKNVLKIVHEYSQRINSFYIDPINIYFKGVSNSASQYLFLNVLQNEFLVKQKEDLDILLKKIFIPLEWNMRLESPHITIGCYKKVNSKMKDIINEYRIIPTCKISQIGVSVVGERGVCLGLLKAFNLKEPLVNQNIL